MKRSLLLVTYEFPPKGGPGVQRPLKLAKYLDREGWNVTVLTVADPPAALMDPQLLDELPQSVRVLRAWSLEPTRLVQTLRRTQWRSRLASTGTGNSYSGAPAFIVRLVQSVFSPDEKRLWAWWAVPIGMRAAARTPFDVIVSSGPPHTAHLVARELATRLQIPYAMDLRDPWVGNYFFKPLTPAHGWLTLHQETRCVDVAAAVVTTADGVTEALRGRYPGKWVTTIHNGYDPDDLPQDVAAPTGGPLVFTHAGTFPDRSTPAFFLNGLALALQRDPSLADRVGVDFVGAGRDPESIARTTSLAAPVRWLKYVPHADSVRRLAASPATLLLLSPETGRRMTIPAKSFEYLAVGRPMLVLAGEGDLRNLLQNVPGVRIVHPRDTPAVAAAIETMAAEWAAGILEGLPAGEAGKYARPRQAAQYAELLEHICSKA